jgi:hypothetical protein
LQLHEARRRAQHPWLGPFRKNDPLRVPFQLLEDGLDEFHGTAQSLKERRACRGFTLPPIARSLARPPHPQF